jgi:hypothetical protein
VKTAPWLETVIGEDVDPDRQLTVCMVLPELRGVERCLAVLALARRV